jgi:hypothetical protein
LTAMGCGGDQAVGLEEHDPALGEGAPPGARLPCCRLVDRQHEEAAEELLRRSVLGTLESTNDLFDIDRGCRGDVTAGPKGSYPIDGGPAAEIVDEHGGVEKDEHGSASATLVCVTLVAYPAGGVGVPRVTVVIDAGCRRLQLRPPLLLLEGLLDGRSHERAPAPRTGQRIDPCDELIVQLYVHSHVQSLAHTSLAH